MCGPPLRDRFGSFHLPSRTRPLLFPSLGRQPDVQLSPLRVLRLLMDLGKQVAVGGTHPGEAQPWGSYRAGLTSPSQKDSFRLTISVSSLQRRGPGRAVQVAGGVGHSWVLFMKSLRRHHPALWVLAGLQVAQLNGSLTRGKFHETLTQCSRPGNRGGCRLFWQHCIIFSDQVLRGLSKV